MERNRSSSPRLQIQNPAYLGAQSFPNIKPVSVRNRSGISDLLGSSAQFFEQEEAKLHEAIKALAPSQADLLKDKNVYAGITAMQELAYSGKYNSSEVLNKVEQEIWGKMKENIPTAYQEIAKEELIRQTLEVTQKLDAQRLAERAKILQSYQKQKLENEVNTLIREVDITKNLISPEIIDNIDKILDDNMPLISSAEKDLFKKEAIDKLYTASRINPLLKPQNFKNSAERQKYLDDASIKDIFENPVTAKLARDMIQKDAWDFQSQRLLQQSIQEFNTFQSITAYGSILDRIADPLEQYNSWQTEVEDAKANGFYDYKNALEKLGEERGFLGKPITHARRDEMKRQGLSGNETLESINDKFLSGYITGQERGAMVEGLNARNAEFREADIEFNELIYSRLGVDLSTRITVEGRGLASEGERLFKEAQQKYSNIQDKNWIKQMIFIERSLINQEMRATNASSAQYRIELRKLYDRVLAEGVNRNQIITLEQDQLMQDDISFITARPPIKEISETPADKSESDKESK